MCVGFYANMCAAREVLSTVCTFLVTSGSGYCVCVCVCVCVSVYISANLSVFGITSPSLKTSVGRRGGEGWESDCGDFVVTSLPCFNLETQHFITFNDTHTHTHTHTHTRPQSQTMRLRRLETVVLKRTN